MHDNINATLDRILDSQETMQETLTKVLIVSGQQEVNIKEHMRRTALLEEDLKPIKKHVALLEAGLKIVGLISILTAIAASVVKILS